MFFSNGIRTNIDNVPVDLSPFLMDTAERIGGYFSGQAAMQATAKADELNSLADYASAASKGNTIDTVLGSVKVVGSFATSYVVTSVATPLGPTRSIGSWNISR